MNRIQNKTEQPPGKESEILNRLTCPSRSRFGAEHELYDALGLQNKDPAIMLSHIIGWFAPNRNGKEKTRIEREGKRWIAVPYEEWWERCRVTRKNSKKWIKALKDLSIIDIRYWRWNGFRTTHITVNWDILKNILDYPTSEQACNIPGEYQMGPTGEPQKGPTGEYQMGPTGKPQKGPTGEPQMGSTHNIVTNIFTNSNTPLTPLAGGKECVYHFFVKLPPCISGNIFNRILDEIESDNLDLDDGQSSGSIDPVIERFYIHSNAPLNQPNSESYMSSLSDQETERHTEQISYQGDNQETDGEENDRFLWTADTDLVNDTRDSEWESRISPARLMQLNGYTMDRDYNVYRLEDIQKPRPKKVRNLNAVYCNIGAVAS